MTTIIAIIACIAPLLMAVVNRDWTYWAMAFPAVFFNPLGADGLCDIKPPDHVALPGKDAGVGWWGLQHRFTDWEECGIGARCADCQSSQSDIGG